MKKPIHVLGICASHRRNGNSSILLNELLKPCQDKGYEVEILKLGNLKIFPCMGCFACNNVGYRCVLKDDLEMVKTKIMEADAIAIAAPCYFLSAPSTLKTIMDRTAAWALDQIINGEKKKFGVSVSVAGGRPEWYSLQRVFTSSFLGLYNCEIIGQVTLGNVAFKGEILLTPSRLKEVYELGRHLAASIEENRCIKYSTDEDTGQIVCPNCFSNVFTITKKGTYICPVCNMELKKHSTLMAQEYSASGVNRFTPAGASVHFDHIGKKILNGMQMSVEIEHRLHDYLASGLFPQQDFVTEDIESSGDDKDVRWEEDALESFDGMVPRAFRRFVKQAIEKKAIQEGTLVITKEVFFKIKKESGN